MRRALTSGQPLAARHASSGGKLPPKGMPVWNYSEWYMSARTNPAIEKYVKYKEDFHLRFRYTPQVAFDSVLWCVIVPFGSTFGSRPFSLSRFSASFLIHEKTPNGDPKFL